MLLPRQVKISSILLYLIWVHIRRCAPGAHCNNTTGLCFAIPVRGQSHCAFYFLVLWSTVVNVHAPLGQISPRAQSWLQTSCDAECGCLFAHLDSTGSWLTYVLYMYISIMPSTTPFTILLYTLYPAISFLIETGALLHFPDTSHGLCTLYFLCPVWLSECLERIMHLKSSRSVARNGVIRTEDLRVRIGTGKLVKTGVWECYWWYDFLWWYLWWCLCRCCW